MKYLLFEKPPLMVNTDLAAIIGLEESLFLQQLHYWLQKSTKEMDGIKWVYNSYKEWKLQFPFWTEKVIGNIVRSLEAKKIVISTQRDKASFRHTKWYSIDYKVLEQTMQASIVPNGTIESPNPDDPYIDVNINSVNITHASENKEEQEEISSLKAVLKASPPNPVNPPLSNKDIWSFVTFFCEKVGCNSQLINRGMYTRSTKEILERVDLATAKAALMTALSDPFWGKVLREHKLISTLSKHLVSFVKEQPKELKNCIDPTNEYYVYLPNGNREPKKICTLIEGRWELNG